MNNDDKDDKDVNKVVDISDIHPSRGDCICPFCNVIMLPISLHTDECEGVRPDTNVEVQCPSCGYKLNPITDHTKHASRLTPKISEGMIAKETTTSVSVTATNRPEDINFPENLVRQ